MTGSDLIALGPWLAVAGTAVAVLVGLSIRRNAKRVTATTCCGLVVAALAIVPAAHQGPRDVGALVVIDGFSLLLTGVFLLGGVVLALVTSTYLKRRGIDQPEEFQAILLLSLVGACVLTGARHFASLFLGIELLSLGLYVLSAYDREDGRSLEAGLEYLVLAGVSSAFLVFGLALAYAVTGTMDLATNAAALAGGEPLVEAAFALALIAFGFKLALVPFHLWAADVYEGAPVPTTAFLATVSKAAMLAVMYRFAVEAEGARSAGVMLGGLAAASMVGGNLLALRQPRIKRIFAGSSIAHVGYLLVGVLAVGHGGREAGAFYLVVYVVSVLLALSVVGMLSSTNDADELADFRGLARRRPMAATGLVIALLSLAGLPITAGFFGKIVLVLAGIRGGLFGLVIVLVATSVLGLFYYLRVIAEVMGTPSGDARPLPAVAARDLVIIGVLAAFLLVFGAYPSPMLEAAAAARPSISAATTAPERGASRAPASGIDSPGGLTMPLAGSPGSSRPARAGQRTSGRH